MEGSSSNSLSFRAKKGFFVPRWAAALAALAALVAALLVGLLAAYLAPCSLHRDAAPGDPHAPQAARVLPDVRLPTHLSPQLYEVHLRPDFVRFTFDGKVKVSVKCLVGGSDNITLQANNITVKAVKVKVAGGGREVAVKGTEADHERQFLVVRLLDERLDEGRDYEVEVDYEGVLNDLLSGFYRSSYINPSGEKTWLATTQFQPTDARRAFPCFDEPAFKAKFDIRITRPPNTTAISNMPLKHSAAQSDGWVLDQFETTVKMSTYLLAFVVSDFKRRGSDKFGVWSRESAIDTTSYALDIGPRILAFYETFFKVKYPLPKTDMVAVPDFSAGAMENWGLITYRETALLFDPRYSSASNKKSVATVISHEIAHQWFGNLVTPAWWDDLWLNEGFASYVEYLGVAAVHPEWEMEQQFVTDDLQDVMELDCLRSSHPISVPVRHPDEINEIFDRISYGKGASIIRMMKHFLGDDNFKNGLMNYLNAKMFENAVQDDLWEHLTKVQAGPKKIDVKQVMDSWTLQTGYPVVHVVRDYSAGSATVRQTRFLLEKGAVDASSWEIPFTYTDGLNPDWSPNTKMWLHRENGSVSGLPGPNYWVVANIQEVGYYRVNYDEQNWALLIRQLNGDHQKIHPVNRAQILDDAMDLARAGLLPYATALNVTLYLAKEQEYVPWKAALHSFGFIDSMICRSHVFGKWKTYVVGRLQPMYDALGWDEKPDEDILKQNKRVNTLVWMCLYGHADCIQTARRKFEEWRKDFNDTRIIPPNLRSLVYCTAVRHGDQNLWDFLWSRYKATQVPSEKEKFMYALTCTREPWLLTRYMNWSMSDESGIRRQDGSSVFRSIGGKLEGRDLAFNFMRDKWQHIFDRYGKSFFAISGLLKSVTNSLNTPFELEQLREFYKKQQHQLGAAKRAFEQSLENAEANVRWRESYFQDIVDWLQQ